eukprot:m.1278909 g.1278909  ORF g.1278909 m.1278909 type:complete len:222 (-) comp24766_c1_seq4:4417-5082(-)
MSINLLFGHARTAVRWGSGRVMLSTFRRSSHLDTHRELPPNTSFYSHTARQHLCKNTSVPSVRCYTTDSLSSPSEVCSLESSINTGSIFLYHSQEVRCAQGGDGAVVLTDRCVRRLAKINEKYENTDTPKKILRVAVDSGGCSGYSYSFDLVDETEIEEDDRVFRKDGAVLVVDDISMDFLKGATVDYTMELIKRAFVVTANPNVEDGCGCGISFSPKEEL